MTSSTKPDPASQTARHQEFSLERINRLISDLEQELTNAPADNPKVRDLKDEIVTLKEMLASHEEEEGWIKERLHAIHDGLQDMTAKAEWTVLKDSPYIAEIGRILGLV